MTSPVSIPAPDAPPTPASGERRAGYSIDELLQVDFARMLRKAGSVPGPFYAYNAKLGRAGFCVQRMDYVEVFAVRAGGGRQVVQTPSGRRYVRALRAGEMYLFRPFDVTSMTVERTGLEASIVMIPLPVWETYVAFVGLEEAWRRSEEPPTASFDSVDPESLRPFSFVIEPAQHVPTRADLLHFLVEVIPRLLPAGGAVGPGPGAPTWLIRAAEAMREYESDLRGGVPRLGELCHVSPQYLSTSVRRYYGMTPTAFVRGLRLAHAVLLLSTTSASIGEIAARCGFATLAHFSNCFRDTYGATPRAFRMNERAAVGR